jgi:membrane fusion protein, copper/silver efflux system
MNEHTLHAPAWAGRKRLLLAGGLVALTGAAIAAAIAFQGEGSHVDSPAHADAAATAMGGMDMSTDGSVRLSAAQLRQFGVTFGTVERRTLQGDVRTVGIVTFDETRIAQVAPKFGGTVERLYVDFTGQPVRAGQPMAEIFSPELVAAQQELLLAAGLDESLAGSSVPGVPASRTSLAEAARRRLRLWDVSDAQIDQVLRSGRARRTITLYAPASGVVVEKPARRG